jgi:RNA polymerase sigma-70 factor (ECF subfamily)
MWNLQRLFQNHARELHRFFRRRGHNAETAADLTQDTFVRVMSATPSGNEHNPRAYLISTGASASLNMSICLTKNGAALPIRRLRQKLSSMTGSAS